MGADFSEKIKGTYKRHLDGALENLVREDLLTQVPTKISRSFRAETRPGVHLAVGQEVVVRLHRGCLVAMDAITPLASCADPPEMLMSAVQAAKGVAKGTVSASHDIAGVVEIICE